MKKTWMSTYRSISPRLGVVVLGMALALGALPTGAQPPVQERPVEAVVTVVPEVFTGDLRALPPIEVWQPGAPLLAKGADHLETAEDPEPRLRPPFPAVPRRDPLVRLQTSAPSPGPGVLLGPSPVFEGIGFTGTLPPDTVGAVGPDHFIQAVNGTGSGFGASFAVWDKQGRPIAGPIALGDLWPGGACAEGRGDPIVLHDPLADRWILSELAIPSFFNCLLLRQDCHLCVAISRTPDPVTGGFHLYDFELPAFPDYPKLGVGPDAYWVGSNHFDALGQRAGAYALERQRMLAGEPARAQVFSAPRIVVGAFIQSLLPADLDGGTPPPAGSPGWFLRYRDGELNGELDPSRDHLEVWELFVDWVAPSRSKLVGPHRVEVAELDATALFVPQPGTSTRLFTFPDPLMWRVAYRNFGDREVLTGNFTVDVTGAGRAGVRWFELRKASDGRWRTFQEGTFSPDEAHRWNASAAMDGAGNLLLGYSLSSPELEIFPSVRLAGRRSFDPPGTLPLGELDLAAGAGFQSSASWGDYSAVTVDPADDCTFWLTNQYVDGNGVWATRVGAFRFASCRAATRPPQP